MISVASSILESIRPSPITPPRVWQSTQWSPLAWWTSGGVTSGSFTKKARCKSESVVPSISGPPGAPGGNWDSPRKCSPMDASP